MKEERKYFCIDLKCFYASVECVERGLDPFKTKLVVADESRGKGAICLAISPLMKMLGVKNRCRLFEIPKQGRRQVVLLSMRGAPKAFERLQEAPRKERLYRMVCLRTNRRIRPFPGADKADRRRCRRRIRKRIRRQFRRRSGKADRAA